MGVVSTRPALSNESPSLESLDPVVTGTPRWATQPALPRTRLRCEGFFSPSSSWKGRRLYGPCPSAKEGKTKEKKSLDHPGRHAEGPPLYGPRAPQQDNVGKVATSSRARSSLSQSGPSLWRGVSHGDWTRSSAGEEKKTARVVDAIVLFAGIFKKRQPRVGSRTLLLPAVAPVARRSSSWYSCSPAEGCRRSEPSRPTTRPSTPLGGKASAALAGKHQQAWARRRHDFARAWI